MEEEPRKLQEQLERDLLIKRQLLEDEAANGNEIEFGTPNIEKPVQVHGDLDIGTTTVVARVQPTPLIASALALTRPAAFSSSSVVLQDELQRKSPESGSADRLLPDHGNVDNAFDQLDDWIDSTSSTHAQQWNMAACLPKIKLEAFDGNPAKWHVFISSFKAYCHDMTPIVAQRMQLLESHLTPRIQSSIAHNLRQPSKHEAALKAFRNLYGNPQMVARAHVAELITIPSVKSSSADALTTFLAELRDCIAAL